MMKTLILFAVVVALAVPIQAQTGPIPVQLNMTLNKKKKQVSAGKVHLHSIGTLRDGAVVAINNHGVFRSDDAGRTWKHFSTALREDTFPHEIINLGPNLISTRRPGPESGYRLSLAGRC